MKNRPSGILTFFHCRQCVEAHRRSHLDIGLVSEDTVRVWCLICGTKVADLALAKAMPMRCDVCGEPVGKGHLH